MLTTPFPYIFDLLMAELKLDPILQAFWERFPCPPPWNTGLLERVNWTSCLGPGVGRQVKTLMVDKCKYDIEFEDGAAVDGGGGERMAHEVCTTPCQVMIALAGLLVLIAVLTAVVFFKFRRKSSKPDSCASPSHQTALNPHGSNKYYTSCHYAASPVIGRHVETTLRGNKMETRVLNGSSKYMDHLYTPSLQQPTPLCYSHAPKQELCLPVSNSFNSNYRRLPEAEYSSSSAASQANSEKSPIYEYIEDSGSLVRDRKSRQSRDLMGFCDCEETGYGSSDTYNSERATQTLPVRHFHRQRHSSDRDRDPCCYGGGRHSPVTDRSASPCCVHRPEHFDIDDSSMSRVSNPRRTSRTRRRPGSGSESGSIYEEGRYTFRGDTQPRPIPALHPHYFCPPELSYR